MKVLLINGSPNKNGCTFTALSEVAATLNSEGIDTEIFWIGNRPIAGCIGCHRCEELGHYWVENDKVSEFLSLAGKADGFVFGSPVYYASANGSLTAFMDRAFISDLVGNANKSFYLKPAAAVVSARRAGTTSTFDQINKYFTLHEMPIISSVYWNMVHGDTPEEVKQDKEGLWTMRTLARNLAYHLRCKQAAQDAGVPFPEQEEPVFTNFIR